jgi:hypothetical protein
MFRGLFMLFVFYPHLLFAQSCVDSTQLPIFTIDTNSEQLEGDNRNGCDMIFICNTGLLRVTKSVSIVVFKASYYVCCVLKNNKSNVNTNNFMI